MSLGKYTRYPSPIRPIFEGGTEKVFNHSLLLTPTSLRKKNCHNCDLK